MSTYFGHATTMYSGNLEKECMILIERKLDMDIVNPALLDTNVTELKGKKLTGKRLEDYKMKYVYLPALDKCDNFVYYLHEGVLTAGVDKEIQRAVLGRKNIYRIVDNIVDTENRMSILNLNTTGIGIIAKRMNDDVNGVREKWALKNADDYIKWFKLNPEAVMIMKEQLTLVANMNEKLWRRAMMTHESSCYATNDFKGVVLEVPCGEKHGYMKHCFINPLIQEKLATCPFSEDSRQMPRYSGLRLESLDLMDEKEFLRYLVSSRTVHGSTFLFGEKVFEENGGIYKRDSRGVLLKNKGGKRIVDYSLIGGMIPIFDLDLVGKNGKDFYDTEVFEQFDMAVEVGRGFVEEEYSDATWKLIYTGKGMYFVGEPLIFDEYDIDGVKVDWMQWKGIWSKDLVLLGNLLKKAGIDKVVVDKKYGWSRYFKLAGALHLGIDRVAIPWNYNERLDRKYMDEHSCIQLESNIMKDAVKRAGW